MSVFSFFNGGYIRDQERVCQTLQFLQWREYWSRTSHLWTGLSNSSASLNGECIGDQERVCQTLQLLQWRVYWWSRTCLSNSSASSMEGVFSVSSRTCLIKNVSVNLFSSLNAVLVMQNFFKCSLNGGCIGDQERVCRNPQFLQWSVYRWSRTCLSNSSASFNGGCIGDQERVCQTLQLLQWSVYRWSRTCLSKSSASLMDGTFFSISVIKNVSVKLSSFINGW